MKPIKLLTLLLGVMLFSAKAYSYSSITVYVDSAGCAAILDTANIGMVDSFLVLQPANNGQISTTPIFGPTYCANPGFSGTDNAVVYACFNSFFPVCDTFFVTFIVQAPSGCNMSVNLQQDLNTVCPGGNRAFDALPIGGTGPYTYMWSDSSTGSTACEIGPGINLCVIVTDNMGCTATACSSGNGCTVNVGVHGDSIFCTGPLPGATAVATSGTAPYNYYWNTGATTETICNLTPGTYCVSVVDANGCNGYNCYSVAGVGNCSFFYYGQNPVLGTNIDFYASFDSSYVATSTNWDFGDGTSGTGLNPNHTYASCGYYYVTFMVNYSNGDSCFYSDYVYAACDSTNGFPQCQAYFYAAITANGDMAFHDYSSYTPVSWNWDFGDGSFSNSPNPVHHYSTQGSFNVCLTVTDAGGCSSSYCQLVSNVPVQDLQANLWHQTTVTPGFPIWVYVSAYNTGSIGMNGTIQYRYPAGTTFNSSSPAPTSHDAANRLLTFDFSSLPSYGSYMVYVDLDASAGLTLGSLAYDTAWVLPVTGDVTPADNMTTISDSVVGSWDPNDKAVSPKGETSMGIVPMTTTELSYRIRFQNTGSAAAQNIMIRDAIDNSIDLTTVKVTSASHQHVTEIIGNELVVTFANINLPDSGADYAASQGYIEVHAKLKPNLAFGTQIPNTANIYFDFNAPVVTNTVRSTLGGVTGINRVDELSFSVMPNPATAEFNIGGEFAKNATYQLMNALGQVVLNGNLNGTNNRVDVSAVEAGVYLVKVKSGSKAGVQRVIVSH